MGRLAAAAALLALGAASCGGGSGGGEAAAPVGDQGEPVSYEQVQAVFEEYACTACHPGVNASLDLTDGQLLRRARRRPGARGPDALPGRRGRSGAELPLPQDRRRAAGGRHPGHRDSHAAAGAPDRRRPTWTSSAAGSSRERRTSTGRRRARRSRARQPAGRPRRCRRHRDDRDRDDHGLRDRSGPRADRGRAGHDAPAGPGRARRRGALPGRGHRRAGPLHARRRAHPAGSCSRPTGRTRSTSRGSSPSRRARRRRSSSACPTVRSRTRRSPTPSVEERHWPAPLDGRPGARTSIPTTPSPSTPAPGSCSSCTRPASGPGSGARRSTSSSRALDLHGGRQVVQRLRVPRRLWVGLAVVARAWAGSGLGLAARAGRAPRSVLLARRAADLRRQVRRLPPDQLRVPRPPPGPLLRRSRPRVLGARSRRSSGCCPGGRSSRTCSRTCPIPRARAC